MVEKSNSSFYIILLFICCLHYNNQLHNISTTILFHYYANSILAVYYMWILFDGVFPIRDDHCKLTFTTSTSFFVSRAHTYYLFFTPRIHVYGGRLFGKELHPVCYYIHTVFHFSCERYVSFLTVLLILLLLLTSFFYSCDQLKWSDRWYCFDFMLLFYYYVIIVLTSYILWYLHRCHNILMPIYSSSTSFSDQLINQYERWRNCGYLLLKWIFY